MAQDLSVVGEQKIISLPAKEAVLLKDVWKDQKTLVVFFRRWGCMLCRLWAKEISEISPVLKSNGVRIVGVGVEEAGHQEFINGKFFDGELFYVQDRSTYQQLGFKRFNMITILASLLWKQSRDAISKGNSMGLGGDTKGDKVQVGGALLIDQDGKLLRNFIQTGPADHLPNEEILKHFGLESEYKAATMANQETDRVCTIDAKA
ncbi:prostamide/prostaglandin F synthase [Plutella xylostella]|uniref:prostamide/prostaglandin F synthase n=1 Tax=Plutella xylostella TaxID=51655 RepID=UPI00203251DB|nr:prostamide/prostaglandin F synthase [Plutella xylostella]